MKYFVIESAKVNGQYANALYQRDTLELAEKEFHTFMGYQIQYDGVSYAMAKVIDECGRDVPSLCRVWYGPEPQPQPQPEDNGGDGEPIPEE